MKSFVVDVNVAVVANNRSSQAGPDDVFVCIEALEQVQQSIAVIDDGHRILDEYRKHLSPKGQPGVGDAFMKWLWNNQANSARCERVHITARVGSEVDFEEFPSDSALCRFDRSDRKYVATALASTSRPEILNATDSDWLHFAEPLERHGVKVRNLCPHLCTKSSKRRK